MPANILTFEIDSSDHTCTDPDNSDTGRGGVCRGVGCGGSEEHFTEGRADLPQDAIVSRGGP